MPGHSRLVNHREHRVSQGKCVGLINTACVHSPAVPFFFILILGFLAAAISLAAQDIRTHSTSSTRVGTHALERGRQPVLGAGSDANLRAVVRKSGLIFDGVVTGVAREGGPGGAPSAYRITFQVKQGMRGVRSGAVVSIREWAGLWSGQDTHEPRYRLGERSVLFLYPLKAGGLTSPVGGGSGKLAVRGGGVVLPVEWMLGGGALGSSASPSVASSAATRVGFASNRISLGALAERIRLAGGE